ncbi:MAG: hypothetical protein V4504_01985 [Patescibacteria group bacterium]
MFSESNFNKTPSDHENHEDILLAHKACEEFNLFIANTNAPDHLSESLSSNSENDLTMKGHDAKQIEELRSILSHQNNQIKSEKNEIYNSNFLDINNKISEFGFKAEQFSNGNTGLSILDKQKFCDFLKNNEVYDVKNSTNTLMTFIKILNDSIMNYDDEQSDARLEDFIGASSDVINTLKNVNFYKPLLFTLEEQVDALKNGYFKEYKLSDKNHLIPLPFSYTNDGKDLIMEDIDKLHYPEVFLDRTKFLVKLCKKINVNPKATGLISSFNQSINDEISSLRSLLKKYKLNDKDHAHAQEVFNQIEDLVKEI